MDSEMIIWQLNGKTFFDLTKQLFIFAWPLLLIILLMSTLAWPWMNQQTEILKARFENRSTIARVAPGSFQESANGNRVFFVDKNSVDNKSQNVFISSTENNKQNMTSAKFGFVDNHDGEKFLILEQGQRVETSLLDNDIKLFEYKTYGTKITSEEVVKKAAGPRSTLTIELIRQPSLETWAN
jgi:lipopolysaccharide export system permease protein